MNNKVKFTNLSLWILSVLLLFVVINLLVGLLFGKQYMDITTDKRYSLSKATVDFLDNNQKHVIIRFYQSKDLKENNQELGAYAEYLRKLLSQYTKQSHSNFELITTIVVPYTSSEEEAKNSGMKEIDFNDGKGKHYLGVSFIRDDGKRVSIPQFYNINQNLVEDEITRLLSVLLSDKMPTIGIISPSLKIVNNSNVLSHEGDYNFVKKLRQQGYNVVSLSEKSSFIPYNIDIVMLYYPLNMSDIVVYALDQYLMRGGNIVIMLDAFSENWFKGANKYVTYNSGLQEFLQNIGISYSEDFLVGNKFDNRNLILEGRNIKYPLWLKIKDKYMAKHTINNGVKELYLNHVGYLKYDKKDNVTETVLLTSENNSGLIKTEMIANLSIDALHRGFIGSDLLYPMAISLEGNFESMFEKPLLDDDNGKLVMPKFNNSSLKPSKVIIIADADMISDKLWQDIKGQSLADNYIFMRNVFDFLADNRYAGVGRKNTLYQFKENFLERLYSISADFYADDVKKISEELFIIKKQILDLNDSIKNIHSPSIKQIKQMEELRRKEISEQNKLSAIKYKIKDTYKNIQTIFAIVVIVIVPLFSVLVLAAIYHIYILFIRKKSGEFIND